MGRMMLLNAHRRGSQANPLGVGQGAGDEELGHRDRLVPHRVMLADPKLVEAQFLGPDDQFQVLLQRLGQRLGRRMKRHDEHAMTNGPRCDS